VATTAAVRAATAATAAATEAATASSPNHVRLDGRPDHGAASARTEELYRDHGRLVGGLCRALLRDRAEAEDATQQVFLAAHRSLLNGTSPREPAAWLATIARNECWARIRARMREPLPTAEVDGEPSPVDPLAVAIRNADLAAMWSAIAALPRQQRDALLLREFGGLSYEDLAGALAVSGSAVESLLFRARQGVRARLQTAYAGLTGASWLESLTRLGGLGTGMAPVAAKVAVVSVGAAVATGGAVVAPQIFDRAPRSHHSAPQHAAPQHAAPQHAAPVTTRQAAVHSLPIFVASARPAATAVPARPAAGDGRGGDGLEDRSSGAARGDGGTSGDSGDSGNPAQSAAHGVRHEDSAGEGSHGTDSLSDGNGSSSGGHGDSSSHGQSSDGQSSDGQGSGGKSSGGQSSPEDNGEVATTTANPVVTVTVPTGDEPPVVGVPSPGGDG
jgi:RNA polymerase sigma factor (sigma-70 family)